MSSELLTRDNSALSRPTKPPQDQAPTCAPEFAVSCKLFDNPVINLQTGQSELVSRYLRANLADNTKRAYQSDLKGFVDWGGVIPASPEQVAAYLALHGATHAAATLSRWLASISKVHETNGFANPIKTELVRGTLRGIMRVHGTAQKQAKPLLREDLYRVLDGMGDRPKDIRDRALLLLGFEGAFRRSELVGLDVGDLEFAADRLIVTLRRSKTDQVQSGRRIEIERHRGRLCPLVAVREWLSLAGMRSGPLFPRIHRSGRVLTDRLSAEAVSVVLRQRLVDAGFDIDGFSAHSLRAGYATSAALSGQPTWRIRLRTGHSSIGSLVPYLRAVSGDVG